VHSYYRLCEQLLREAAKKKAVFEGHAACFIGVNLGIKLEFVRDKKMYLVKYDEPKEVAWEVHEDGLYQDAYANGTARPVFFDEDGPAVPRKPSVKVDDRLLDVNSLRRAVPLPLRGFYGYKVADKIVALCCVSTFSAITPSRAAIGTPVFISDKVKSTPFKLSPDGRFIYPTQFWRDLESGRIINLNHLIKKAKAPVRYNQKQIVVPDGLGWVGVKGPVTYRFIGKPDPRHRDYLDVDLRNFEQLHD